MVLWGCVEGKVSMKDVKGFWRRLKVFTHRILVERGVVLYAMTVGVLPFRYPRNEASTITGRRQLLLERISKGLGSTHREQMKHLSIDCQQLLERLLDPNQHTRITLRDLFDHAWIVGDHSLPSLSAKPSPYVASQVSTEAYYRLSALLSMPIKDLEMKVKQKSHDHVFAMYHLLRSNLEKAVIREEVGDVANLGCSDDLSNLGEIKSANPSRSGKLPRDEGISPSERDFSGSSHINAKNMSHMDMELSKILYLDKMNASAPVIQGQQASNTSKKSFEDIVLKMQEASRSVSSSAEMEDKSFLNFSYSSVKKTNDKNIRTPPSQRKKDLVGSRNKMDSKDREVSQKSDSSCRVFRSEESRAKLKEQLYLEDVRSRERMGLISSGFHMCEEHPNFNPETNAKYLKRIDCLSSDARKMDDIKKFNSGNKEVTLKIKKKPIIETERVATLRNAGLGVARCSEKNSRKKSAFKTRDIPSAGLPQLPSYENCSYSSIPNSNKSGRLSRPIESIQVGSLKAESFKSGSRISQRIHQDTVSSMQKKNFRAGAPVERSDSARNVPTAHGSRTFHQSPTRIVPGAKPALSSSRTASKIADTKHVSDSRSFVSNRNAKIPLSNSTLSHLSGHHRPHSERVAPRKESTSIIHSDSVTDGSTSKKHSNAVHGKVSPGSPVLNPEKIPQGEFDAFSATSTRGTPSNQKLPSNEEDKIPLPNLLFPSVINNPGIPVGPKDMTVDFGVNSKDLPFPTKAVIHKSKQSPRFMTRPYKKS